MTNFDSNFFVWLKKTTEITKIHFSWKLKINDIWSLTTLLLTIIFRFRDWKFRGSSYKNLQANITLLRQLWFFFYYYSESSKDLYRQCYAGLLVLNMMIAILKKLKKNHEQKKFWLICATCKKLVLSLKLGKASFYEIRNLIITNAQNC